ncbi:hypothetical protein J132_04440 [Termitomyces sp. J132]|nr:hypothetical protein J132_04440 [Termitomyces sp. J132]
MHSCLAVAEETCKWSGHEAFSIAAPTVASNLDNKTLGKRFFPNIPVQEGKTLNGTSGFFDRRKPERLLGWVHKDNLLL